MDPAKVIEVAQVSLTKARYYMLKRNWARSFSHFLVYFQLFPNEKNNYEEQFTVVLYHLGITLEKSNKLENLCNSYKMGMNNFPRNKYILNNFGSHLLRLDLAEVALGYLESARNIDETFLNADKNLQTAKLNLIPRWHFYMLNDQKRNEAYRTAIHEAVTIQNNIVLDIGAGCGLLSFYASECPNVESITAIEGSSVLSKMATSAFENCDNIKVINKISTELTSQDIGLSNLLITEIFDTALFGEHILETLIHAWNNLLEPTAKVIPSGGNLFITGISSSILSSKHRICNNLTELGVADLCITQACNEPYDADNLKEIPVTYITDTQSSIQVDFSNLQQLNALYSSYNAVEVTTLKCICDGTIDAFAVWFDLHLNEHITITTDCHRDNVTCWEQAIIYLDHPIALKIGQEVNLQVSCVANKLEVKVLNPIVTCQDCKKVSQKMITFLNDVDVVKAAQNLVFPNKFTDETCEILDMNPFPLFAFMQAKRGVRGNYKCVAENDLDSNFINFLWHKSVDHQYKINIYHPSELATVLPKQSIDVIFMPLISKNGILCEDMYNKFQDFIMDSLKKSALIFPKNLTLHMELIESNYLDICSRVYDENLFGFNIAEKMNAFSVLEQWQIEPQSYKRKTLCKIIGDSYNIRDSVCRKQTAYEEILPIDSRPNGVLHWYEIEFSENVLIDTYKSLHYKGACFLFEHSKHLCSGDKVNINVQRDKSFLKITNGNFTRRERVENELDDD